MTLNFAESGFMPHGHCYLWQPALVWTNVITDGLIGLAYVSISLSLYGLIRKIKLPFSAMVLSFGIFIGACGATHFLEVWNLWNANYWLAGLVKIITATASVATGIWLIRLRPQIIHVANMAKLTEQHRRDLEIANSDLRIRSEQLEQTNRLLAEQQKALAHSARMSALGEMAGGIAHEINSPLGIITVRANQLERLLTRGSLTPEAVTKEAQLIAATAKRIGDIIKGLRAFAREGENDPFEKANVAGVLQDALALCQSKFKSQGIALVIDDVDRNVEVECRTVQLGQVLLNLLSNAHDAVQALSEKWVKVAVEDRGPDLLISVTDSGPGIPTEVADRLMEPFYTTKEVGKGTGLGLSISKGIIDAHQGKIELDRHSPNTRFNITLPKFRAPEEDLT